jgi:hypothetical protein
MIFVDYPGHFVAALLLIAVGGMMVWAFWSKELKRVGLWRELLVLLKYAAIVILLLILWNPSRPEVSHSTARNSVLVFFDTSQSMSIVDSGPETRLAKALDIFVDKFRPSDPEGPDYKVYGFDRQCYYSGSRESLRLWGQQTWAPLYSQTARLTTRASMPICRFETGICRLPLLAWAQRFRKVT